MDAARTEPDVRDTARLLRDALEARELRDAGDSRIDSLLAEASAAVSYSANTLRSVSDRYRGAYNDELTRWQSLTDELESLERRGGPPPAVAAAADGAQPKSLNHAAEAAEAAAAAEAGAEDGRVRGLRSETASLGSELGKHQAELTKLEIALGNLESTWLFLERGDVSLIGAGAGLPIETQMRIVEAQESERSRLAQEVHDGPAQALANAIFQVEYIERVIDNDTVARSELQVLRDQLRRELNSVRIFISQLRPRVLDELGLNGAVGDAVARTTALTDLSITTELTATAERLSETQQTVVLRIVQEALQNVRKHGGASSVIVASAIDGGAWVLTVRDDGRGFDVGAVAARGRRNFGLQFMQERAELIGAQFEVQSRPDGGTLVRLAIPIGT